MMVNEKVLQVLKHEGVVAIATQGVDGPHLVNTWNSYVQFTDDGQWLIPAGFMKQTEANVEKNNKVLLTIGTREEEGFNGPGTGFLIKGTASFTDNGPEFEIVKQKFPWARAVLKINIISADQTL